MVTVKYAELLDAFEFVSSGAPFEHSAYICADTGAIYWASSMIELEEKVPDNLETSDRYIAVPHKNDLNLVRNLALSFVHKAKHILHSWLEEWGCRYSELDTG